MQIWRKADRQQIAGGKRPILPNRTVRGQIRDFADLRFSLPFGRKMIGILRDKDVGDPRIGRHATLDQPCRRRRLHNPIFATPGNLGRRITRP